METNFHFQFGNARAITLFDGIFETQADEFFLGAPPDRLEAAYAAHDMLDRQFRVAIVCLYLEINGRRILIDTGVGPTYPSPGRLPEQLAAENISPVVIDAIICSHAHFDHIWGNTDAAGRPAFPNATYYLGRAEYEAATAPDHEAAWGEDAPRFRQNLQGIRDHYTLVEPDAEILPGIRTLAAPGHTAGQVALLIQSGGEEMLYVGDVVHHPIHLEHPDWYYAYDALPEQVAPTRRRLFTWAAERNALVFAPHLPPAGVGRVMPEGEGWRWEPLQATGHVGIFF